MESAAPAPAPTDAGQGLAPAAEPTAPEPVAPATDPAAPAPAPAPEVQPAAPDATTTQPDGGQGLIAPYLEGVDPQHRDVVAAALDKYRADSDAQITKRFEELNGYKQFAESPAELEAPVYLYERLMEEPVEALKWVFSEFEKAGIDLRSQLLGEATAPAATDPAAPAGETADDQPLTREQVRAEFERLEQEREAQRQQGQEASQRKELVEGWLAEATKAHELTLEDGDIALRQAILTHAAQLLPKLSHLGDGAGKAAVTTAVEAFVNRFGKTPAAPAADPNTPEPTVANGGTPPAPPEVTDLSGDPKARKAFMLSLLQRPNNQE